MKKTIIDEVLGYWYMPFAHQALIKITESLSEAQFVHQPGAAAPPAGWHIFHIARLAAAKDFEPQSARRVPSAAKATSVFSTQTSSLLRRATTRRELEPSAQTLATTSNGKTPRRCPSSRPRRS